MIKGFVKLYREQGLNVMPLKPKSKFPALVEWKKFQTEKYTGDFEPDQNGAVICGKSSNNLIVIDLDAKELATHVFEDFEALKKETLIVETGKGYHIYIRPDNDYVPDTSIRTINEKGQRIDIQCHGTYVLIPGSIHPDTGKEYKIISTTLNIKKINLDGFIKRLGEIGFNVENKRKKMVEVLKGVTEGERNDSGFRLAMCARHFWDLKDTELLTILTYWNKHYVFPPMSDLEIKNIVQSAMSYNIDDIKFKDIVDEVKNQEKTYEMKYDDNFWKVMEGLCKENNRILSRFTFRCKNCKKNVKLRPEVTLHRNHIITIKYK